jgi:hypothetical protein
MEHAHDKPWGASSEGARDINDGNVWGGGLLVD